MRKAIISLVTIIFILLSSPQLVLGTMMDSAVFGSHFTGNAIDNLYGRFNGTASALLTTDKNDISNGAYAFNSKNITYSNSSTLNPPKNFSLSLWIKPNGTGDYTLVSKQDSSGKNGYTLFHLSGANLYFQAGSGGAWADIGANAAWNGNNAWYHIVVTYNSTDGNTTIYLNNATLVIGHGVTGGIFPSTRNLTYGQSVESSSYNYNGKIDEILIFNKTLTQDEVTQLFNLYDQWLINTTVPFILNVTCRSCNPPNGSTQVPYTTTDVTPTFNFTTNSSANCRIADEDWNYSTMNSSRQCTSGEASTYHICTLTVQDQLLYPTDYVYVHCINSVNASLESNATLLMNITNLEVNGSELIQEGIENSVVWPDATVYDNQKVYLRKLNGSQLLTTVDKVVVSGNQRWLFNYAENNQSIGLFNLTPVVYVLELINAPLFDIPDIITNYINSTKT